MKKRSITCDRCGFCISKSWQEEHNVVIFSFTENNEDRVNPEYDLCEKCMRLLIDMFVKFTRDGGGDINIPQISQ